MSMGCPCTSSASEVRHTLSSAVLRAVQIIAAEACELQRMLMEAAIKHGHQERQPLDARHLLTCRKLPDRQLLLAGMQSCVRLMTGEFPRELNYIVMWLHCSISSAGIYGPGRSAIDSAMNKVSCAEPNGIF